MSQSNRCLVGPEAPCNQVEATRSTVNAALRYTYPPGPCLGVYQSQNAFASVTSALEAGYRSIDTARVYKNETAVGEAIRTAIKGGASRDEIFVTSKVNARSHSAKETPKAIRQSLTRSGLSYLDLYLLHDAISGQRRRLEAYKCLLAAQKAGQIRFVGVSNWNVHHLQELLEARLPLPVANQIELHPWCQQKPIVLFCREHNIGVQAYSPLVRGTKWEDAVLKDVAAKNSLTPAQVLLCWSMQRGFWPVVKSDNSARIRENIRAIGEKLPPEALQQLDALDQGDRGACTWNPVNVP